MDASERAEIVERARREGEERNALVRWICSNCGSLMKPRKSAQGNGSTEFALWAGGLILTFSIAFSAIGLALLACAFAYSLWRAFSARLRSCSACGSRDIFPANTPRGRDELMHRGIIRSPDPSK